MGKREREDFRRELERNHSHREDNEAFWEQNAKTAAAEKKCGPLEKLWVRGMAD